MRRKIIKIADKTYVITLPLTWINQYQLQKGDELELSQNNNELTITAPTKATKQAISLSIVDLHDATVRWLLSALHKSGYDEIELFYAGNHQSELVTQLLKDLFTGFGITQLSEKRILISALAADIPAQFDVVLRRAFRITLEMADELHQRLVHRQYSLLQQTIEFEKINNQLTNFCQRLLNKKKFANEKTHLTHFLYVILWNLEKIADNYKYLCNYCATLSKDAEIDQTLLSLLNQTNLYLKNYYELYYQFSLQRLNQLAQHNQQLRQQLQTLMPATPQDVFILNILNQLILQITDFSASIIAVQQAQHQTPMAKY